MNPSEVSVMFELDLSLMKLIHHGDDEHSQADALVKTE
jgi:hypothetical protein